MLHFQGRGFKVSIEGHSVGYPSRPTIISTRDPQTVFGFVVNKMEKDRLRSWVSYCKSCNEDVRVCIYLEEEKILGIKDLQFCRNRGIGVYVWSADDYQCLNEEIDLAFNAELPDIKEFNRDTRRLLGPAYDLFHGGKWREGFECAVRILEEDARRYLLRQINAGRADYNDPKNTKKTLNRRQVSKFTLGQLKDIFCNLLSQNSLEAHLCAGLSRLNPTRIERIHRPSSRRTEKRMRDRVGQDMWAIVDLIREMNP